MMVTNTVGAALFMRILLDKRAMFEKYTSAFSATAPEKVAASTEGILRQGFNEENSMKVAQVLYKEAGHRRGGDHRSRQAAGVYRHRRRPPSAGQNRFLLGYTLRD